jgi:hypothetical protein
MSGRKTIGFSINISLPTQIVGTPELRNVVNKFDLSGVTLTLKRLEGESNAEYRKRLWDVSVHPGSPLYQGVASSIARDLGYLRQPAMEIDLKLDSAGGPIAVSPRFEMRANRVILYSDWRPDGTEVIDKEIRTYQLGDEGYYLDDLVAAINQSQCFSATILQDTRPNLIASTLVRITSGIIIRDDPIRADRQSKLDHEYIARSSLAFTEKTVFNTEITGNPAASGEFSVDYVNGRVHAYDLPDGEGSCSYHANIFPLEVEAVPVQIFTFQDEDFQSELFHKATLDSGAEVNALPNVEGAEIYHQLFTETEVFWGV